MSILQKSLESVIDKSEDTIIGELIDNIDDLRQDPPLLKAGLLHALVKLHDELAECIARMGSTKTILEEDREEWQGEGNGPNMDMKQLKATMISFVKKRWEVEKLRKGLNAWRSQKPSSQ